LADSHKATHEEALSDVASFVNERWRGVRPIAWGDSLVEAQFTRWLYEGVCGLSEIVTNKEEKI
jgi:glycerol-3-phosphate dehydrogenase